MIKQILHLITVVVLSLAVSSCGQEPFADNDMDTLVPEGYVQLRFGVDIPDMMEIQTRGVDPDGKSGIESMKLFCFNEYGRFISVVSAEIEKKNGEGGVSLSGTFKAQVAKYTKIIHLVGNQDMDNFNESEHIGEPEGAVMTTLVASSHKMVYWGRVEATAEQTIETAIQSYTDGIPMTRNQARVRIMPANLEEGYSPAMTVLGFYVFNTSAFGTIAPYNSAEDKFDWFDPDINKYTTLMPDTDKATDPDDVVNQSEQCVFETANTAEDPVNVIIYAHPTGGNPADAKYYRVMLMQDGKYLPIIRNHSYDIYITGTLEYGQSSVEAALQASATNNIWVAISDNISTVWDSSGTMLSVDETFVVVPGKESWSGDKVELGYQYTGTETPTVEWVSNEATTGDLSQHIFDNKRGTIPLELLALGSASKLESVLRVKAGNLQRTIKLIVVKQFKFEPAWVSTEIYQGDAGQKVTLMFTIPEDTPEELFPMKVLISTNHLDIRPASGMQLETITQSMAEGNNEYFGDPNIEYGKYKYGYVVENPGIQRIYFRTTLPEAPEDGEEIVADKLYVESEFFEILTKDYTYSEVQEEILVEDLTLYTPGDDDEIFAKDEPVQYRLVPQKVNAFVQFKIQHGSAGKADGKMFEGTDEFLLYSSNLTKYEDKELAAMDPVIIPECSFESPVEEGTQWGSGGRVYKFYPVDQSESKSEYNIYLKTNKAKSAEVVRIASYHDGPNTPSDEAYKGNTYKSITFELANNDPFKFSSTLENTDGQTDETEDDQVVWTYGYQQKVDLELDITSFKGTDGVSADPFGTEFKVYIDAPMLEIHPDGGIDESKFYEESEGRFVYVVDEDRGEERTASAAYVTTPSLDFTPCNINQDYERKILPFRTKSIVSEGTITISSEKDVVVFDDETYTISNKLIEGTVKYKPEDSSAEQAIKKGAFVTFERSRDGTRIGIMNITNDEGSYTLRLRQEYTYSWQDDPVSVHYRTSDGKLYHADIESLESFFDGNKNLVLEYEDETKQ